MPPSGLAGPPDARGEPSGQRPPGAARPVDGSAPTTRLRVMTFNVRGFTSPADGANRWPLRATHNVATVREHAPDLLGVQELQPEALATYREQLPEYGLVLGPAAGNARRPEYNAILFDPARLEVIDTGGFWLSETPDVPSSSWRSHVVRTVNEVTFAVRDTDVRFRHVNTHLDHWSGLARTEGARLLLRRVAQVTPDDPPTVVTGDFNCPPDSAPYRTFLAQGYEDTYAGDDITFHGFGGVRSALVRRLHRLRHGRRPQRLDWILVGDAGRRWHVDDAAIVRDRDPVTGVPPSDHYPVLAQLRLG